MFNFRFFRPYGPFVARPLVLGSCLVALLISGGCQEPPPPPPPPPVDPGYNPNPVFTQQDFDEILFGITYPEAVELLGAESNRQESTYHEGESDFVQPYVTAWYYWENKDGSYIKLGFVDKMLTEKMSEDLPQE